MSPMRWLCLLAVLAPGLRAQSTHMGIPAAQTLVLEGIVTSPTERHWTLYQGGQIHASTDSAAYTVPGDKKLVITDVQFSLRGQSGKSGNVALQVKSGVKTFVPFRLSVRLLAGLDQNIYGDHLTTPIVVAEGSEITAYLNLANAGVGLESMLLRGYFLPAGH